MVTNTSLHSALSLRVFGEDITTAAKEAALKKDSGIDSNQEGGQAMNTEEVQVDD